MAAADPRKWLLDQWTAAFAQAIASMIGDTPHIAAGAGEETASAPDLLWWQQGFSIGDAAKFWVGAPADSWKSIGNEILKSAGIDDGDEESIKSTYREILSQSLSGVAQALSSRARKEISCTTGAENPPDDPKCTPIQVDLNGSSLKLFAAFTAELAAPPAVTEPAAPKAQAAAARSNAAAEPAGYPKGLDRLLDVELPVSVSFGRAEVAIKDVIKLTTGSIVELNRTVSEPVDVIVNNVVIARGEVVVVEGNFGVRIKHVISRQERIQTLR